MGNLFGNKNVFNAYKRENLFNRTRRVNYERKVEKRKKEATEYGFDFQAYFSIMEDPELRKYIPAVKNIVKAKNYVISFKGLVGASGAWKDGTIYIKDEKGRIIGSLYLREYKGNSSIVNQKFLSVLKALAPNKYTKLINAINKENQISIETTQKYQTRVSNAYKYLGEIESKLGRKLTPEEKSKLFKEYTKGVFYDVETQKASPSSPSKTQLPPSSPLSLFASKGYKVVGGYTDTKKGEVFYLEKDGVGYTAYKKGQEYIVEPIKYKSVEEAKAYGGLKEEGGLSSIKGEEVTFLSKNGKQYVAYKNERGEIILKEREDYEVKKAIDNMSPPKTQRDYEKDVVEYTKKSIVSTPQYLMDTLYSSTPLPYSLPLLANLFKNEKFEKYLQHENDVRFKRMEEYSKNTYLMSESLYNYVDKWMETNLLQKVPNTSEINATFGVLENPLHISIPTRTITKVVTDVPNIIATRFIAGIPSWFADVNNAVWNTETELASWGNPSITSKEVTKERRKKLPSELTNLAISVALLKSGEVTRYLSKPIKVLSPKLEAFLVKEGNTGVGAIVKRSIVPTAISSYTFLQGAPMEKAIAYGLSAGVLETLVNRANNKVKARMSIYNKGKSSVELHPSLLKEANEVRKATEIMKKIDLWNKVEVLNKPSLKQEIIQGYLNELKGLGKGYYTEYLRYRRYYTPHLSKMLLPGNPQASRVIDLIKEREKRFNELYEPRVKITKYYPGLYEGLEGGYPEVVAYLDKNQHLVIQKNDLGGLTTRYKVGLGIRKTLIHIKNIPSSSLEFTSKFIEDVFAKPYYEVFKRISLRLEKQKPTPSVVTSGVQSKARVYSGYTPKNRLSNFVRGGKYLVKEVDIVDYYPTQRVTPKPIIKEELQDTTYTIKSFMPSFEKTIQKIEQIPSQKTLTKQRVKTNAKNVLKPTTKTIEKPVTKTIEKPLIKEVEKLSIKPVIKTTIKTIEKPIIKEVEKTTEKLTIKQNTKPIIYFSTHSHKRRKTTKKRAFSKSYNEFHRDITNIVLGVGGSSYTGLGARGKAKSSKKKKRNKKRNPHKKIKRRKKNGSIR